jgi:hypothetical protein
MNEKVIHINIKKIIHKGLVFFVKEKVLLILPYIFFFRQIKTKRKRRRRRRRIDLIMTYFFQLPSQIDFVCVKPVHPFLKLLSVLCIVHIYGMEYLKICCTSTLDVSR